MLLGRNWHSGRSMTFPTSHRFWWLISNEKPSLSIIAQCSLQLLFKLEWVSVKTLHICIRGSTTTTTTTKSLQSCPILCDPIDGSPPGSPVPGILQARTLEWVAISFSSAWMWKVKVKSLSRVQLLETPWTAAHQAPLSMGFSRQKYWSGVPLPSPIRGSRLWQKPTQHCKAIFLQLKKN